jgi:ribosomal protein S18 acetylase RimI-like enzyme
MPIKTRWPTCEDADFLKRIKLIAVGSHLLRGTWDPVVNSTEEDVLKYARAFVVASAPSLFHFSHLLILEVEGQLAAALCGYDPEKTTWELITSRQHRSGASDGNGPSRRGSQPISEAPSWEMPFGRGPGGWITENVATLPEYRRRGFVHTLLEEMLKIGESRRHRLAQISVLIGNPPAQCADESRLQSR